mmetsp:Transcript_12402/g.20553  ORF Transcript_12402/g.20553 Transcript_12402/m.20553 type:complete len:201 (-) Transcript_12402:368-970(-)
MEPVPRGHVRNASKLPARASKSTSLAYPFITHKSKSAKSWPLPNPIGTWLRRNCVKVVPFRKRLSCPLAIALKSIMLPATPVKPWRLSRRIYRNVAICQSVFCAAIYSCCREMMPCGMSCVWREDWIPWSSERDKFSVKCGSVICTALKMMVAVAKYCRACSTMPWPPANACAVKRPLVREVSVSRARRWNYPNCCPCRI